MCWVVVLLRMRGEEVPESEADTSDLVECDGKAKKRLEKVRAGAGRHDRQRGVGWGGGVGDTKGGTTCGPG